MSESINVDTLRGTIQNAIKAARQYYNITGKPLGITGEVGEFLAADLMDLKLTEARQPGYDAVGNDRRRIQIKARCVKPGSNPGQRMGSIKLTHPWDTVMLILMDIDFNPLEIYEARRTEVESALLKPGSKARNERGALSVSKFKSIATFVWPK